MKVAPWFVSSALALAALSAVPAPRTLRADDEEGKKDAPEEPKKGESGKDGGKDGEKPTGKKDEKPGEKKEDKDDVDTESLEAKTLAGKLHVPPNWRPKSGTVDLSYTLNDDPQMLDWKFQGCDKAEQTTGGLEVGVSSSGTGFGLLDAVEFKGDFTIQISVTLDHYGPSTDVMFLVGVKGSDAIGLRYGDQYVRLKSGKMSRITTNPPSQDKFALGKLVELKIVRKGEELQTWINKMERPRKKLTKKELDGKVGFYGATNLRMRISSYKVQGVIDKSKL